MWPQIASKFSVRYQVYKFSRPTRYIFLISILDTLSQKERDRMLATACIEAFATAAARNERARTNKWLRWKYADELRKEESWLDGTGVDDMGWAVGRRIYEKEEIEVRINSYISY